MITFEQAIQELMSKRGINRTEAERLLADPDIVAALIAQGDLSEAPGGTIVLEPEPEPEEEPDPPPPESTEIEDPDLNPPALEDDVVVPIATCGILWDFKEGRGSITVDGILTGVRRVNDVIGAEVIGSGWVPGVLVDLIWEHLDSGRQIPMGEIAVNAQGRFRVRTEQRIPLTWPLGDWALRVSDGVNDHLCGRIRIFSEEGSLPFPEPTPEPNPDPDCDPTQEVCAFIPPDPDEGVPVFETINGEEEPAPEDPGPPGSTPAPTVLKVGMSNILLIVAILGFFLTRRE